MGGLILLNKRVQRGVTGVSIKNKERSGVDHSSPASQEVQSLRGFNYFLKGGRVGVGSIFLHSKNADFNKVLLSFKVWCLSDAIYNRVNPQNFKIEFLAHLSLERG